MPPIMELRCTPDKFSQAKHSCVAAVGPNTSEVTIAVDHLSVDDGNLQMSWPGSSGILDKEHPPAMTFDCNQHSCKVTYDNDSKDYDLKLCKDKQETTATFFKVNKPVWSVILQA